MEGDPELHPPHWLPWDAKARLMLAYAAECRAIAASLPGADAPAGWLQEAKKAERKARSFLAIHRLKAEPARPRPLEQEPA